MGSCGKTSSITDKNTKRAGRRLSMGFKKVHSYGCKILTPHKNIFNAENGSVMRWNSLSEPAHAMEQGVRYDVMFNPLYTSILLDKVQKKEMAYM